MDLLSLPEELILVILGWCGGRAVGLGLRLCCKLLHRLSHDPQLWLELRAPLSQPPPAGRSQEFMYMIEHCDEEAFRTIRSVPLGDDGAYYFGEVTQLHSHGWGIIKWKSVTRMGEMYNGTFQGVGIQFGDKHLYCGGFLDGRTHGFGRYTWTGGDVYTGTFKNGKQDGYGEYTHSDGSYYRGYWSNDARDGFGEYRWGTTRDVYVGHFKMGIKHGSGTYYWADGRRFTGVWKDGTRDGTGEYVFTDGTRYIGEFKGKVRHGMGTLVLPDGVMHFGEWISDIPSNPLLAQNKYNGLLRLSPAELSTRLQHL